MDLKLIRNLVRIMERGDVCELEVADEPSGLRVHLKRGTQGLGAQAPVMVMQGSAVAAPLSGAPEGADDGDESPSRAAGVEEVTSPMVGSFYRGSSPESDPFVSVGATVGDESVVCIIEAMKVMNEIHAEMSGEVVEILVEDGEPVEFGQPLFLIKTR
jgi:acetyl-CoA carboxylase biotin carboxyl carrier protein